MKIYLVWTQGDKDTINTGHFLDSIWTKEDWANDKVDENRQQGYRSWVTFREADVA